MCLEMGTLLLWGPLGTLRWSIPELGWARVLPRGYWQCASGVRSLQQRAAAAWSLRWAGASDVLLAGLAHPQHPVCAWHRHCGPLTLGRLLFLLPGADLGAYSLGPSTGPWWRSLRTPAPLPLQRPASVCTGGGASAQKGFF